MHNEQYKREDFDSDQFLRRALKKIILLSFLFSLFFCPFVYAYPFSFPGSVSIKFTNGKEIKAESCTQEDEVTLYTLPGGKKVYKVSNAEIESISNNESANESIYADPVNVVTEKPLNLDTRSEGQEGYELIPSGTPKAWALAVTAILNERNKEYHDILGGRPLTPKNIKRTKDSLSKWWNVNNRVELLEALKWIESGGHRESFTKAGAVVSSLSELEFETLLRRLKNDEEAINQVMNVRKYYRKFGMKSIIGWDYARYISLCRWGYLVGYLTEEEAWSLIMPVALIIQENFKSWEEFGENYIVGREFWSKDQTEEGGRLYWNIYNKLLIDSKSPWKTNAWNMNLRQK